MSVTLSDETYAVIEKLMAMETRSASNVIAAIVERSLPDMRQEWQAERSLPSLKKKKRRIRDKKFIELYGE